MGCYWALLLSNPLQCFPQASPGVLRPRPEFALHCCPCPPLQVIDPVLSLPYCTKASCEERGISLISQHPKPDLGAPPAFFPWTYPAIPAVPAVQWACKTSACAWRDGADAHASIPPSSDSDNMPRRQLLEDFASLWITGSVSHSMWMANCILKGQPKMLDHKRGLLLIYQSLPIFWIWQQEGSWKQPKPRLGPKLLSLISGSG